MYKHYAALTSIALALLAAGAAHAQATLVISPQTLTLFAQAGGSPVTTSVSFTSSDNGATSLPFTLNPGNPWITVSAPSQGGTTYKTPATVVVTVTPTSLSPGQNNGSISVFSAQFATLPVSVMVSSITVFPSSISLGTYQAGSTVYPSSQTLTVTGANGNFTVSKAPADNWYTAAAYGNPLSAVLVQFNQAVASSLTPSTTPLTGTLTITPGGNSPVPVTVPITLTVTASPQVTVNPVSMVFNWQSLGTNNQTQQILTLTSNAPQAVSFTASAPGINWITLPSNNPTSIPANGSTQLAVQVNGNSQPQGPSSGSILIAISGALFPNGTTTLTVPVQLNVSSSPLLYSSPPALTYSYQFGSLVLPASQNVTPTSSGAPNQQLQYNVSTPSNAPWLSTAPTGTLTTGGAPFTVSVNTAGLSPGVYTSNITVTPVANGSNQAAITVPVTLTVSFQSILLVSSTQLVFPFEVGQSAPVPQVVSLSSSTGAPLNYVVTAPSAATAPWVQVLGGLTGVTDQTSITVSINPAGVPSPAPAGYLDATITVAATDPNTGAAINTVNIDVRLYASTTPQLVVSPPGPLQFSTYPSSPAYPLSNTTTINLSSTSPAAGDAVTITGFQRSVNNQAVTGDWLGGTTPASMTPTSFTVNATQLSATTMPPGVYTGTVSIAANGPNGNATADSPISLAAVFVIDSAKGTIITPRSDGTLVFTQTQGSQAPAAQTVQVTTDTGSLPFDAVVNTGLLSWLSVTTPSGPTPGSFNVSANAANLTTGVYSGAIYVTIPNAAGSPFRIPVTLTVTGGTITAPTTPLNFTQIVGGAAPAPQTVQVTSSPSSVIYTVSAASATPVNSNWLAASITSGAGTTPGTVTVTVTPGNLPASTTPYQGTITITSSGATGSPITIPVTLTVEQATLIAPTTALTFNQLAGGAAPAAQSVAVTSTPGPIPITVSATTTNGVAWLSATAGSNGATGTTPATVQISVNSGSLPAGPYSGLVIITSAGATGSPIGIPVLLNVGTASVFTISQTSLTFSASLGQATTPQTVQLTATSSAPFAVATTTKDGASWLTASPSSGTAGSTATTLTISANTQSLAVGNYSGAITISSANILTPVTINVSLTVSAIPTPVLVAVKNAASYVAGAVSPGENIVIGGTGIGPATLAGAQLTSTGQLSTNVGNTQVLFDGTPAPIVYASATQTSVMVPYEIAGRSVTNIQVVYSNIPSAALAYNVVQAVPGIYSQNLQGFGPGVILNSNNVTVNGPNTPAAKGSEVVIYMTGEGVTIPSSTTGAVAGTPGNPANKPAQTVTATVGGLPATVVYAASAPGIVYGVMQVNINIPANAPTGALPLVINIGNTATQAGITVAVQ